MQVTRSHAHCGVLRCVCVCVCVRVWIVCACYAALCCACFSFPSSLFFEDAILTHEWQCRKEENSRRRGRPAPTGSPTANQTPASLRGEFGFARVRVSSPTLFSALFHLFCLLSALCVREVYMVCMPRVAGSAVIVCYLFVGLLVRVVFDLYKLSEVMRP